MKKESKTYREGTYYMQLKNIRSVLEYCMIGAREKDREEENAMDYKDGMVLIHNMLVMNLNDEEETE